MCYGRLIRHKEDETGLGLHSDVALSFGEIPQQYISSKADFKQSSLIYPAHGITTASSIRSPFYLTAIAHRRVAQLIAKRELATEMGELRK